MPYDPDDLDYFFVATSAGGLYLVPMNALAGRVMIDTGAYSAYHVGDASSLLTTAA